MSEKERSEQGRIDKDEEKRLHDLSAQRDQQLDMACAGGPSPACSSAAKEAILAGNNVYTTPDGHTYAISKTDPVFRSADPYDQRDGTFQQMSSESLSQSLPVLAIAATPEIVATLGAGKMATGAVLGAGFDAAGQYTQLQPGDTYRPLQTVVAGVTGAVAFPLSGSSIIGDAVIGGAVSAANTAMTNELYGKNDSVLVAGIFGAGFSGMGTYVGGKAANYASEYLPTNINATYINPSIPLFQQTINLGVANPYPALIGAVVSNTIAGVPSFIPLPVVEGSSK